MSALDRRFSVAPMMDWTTRHCRVFHRLLSQHAVLYTEMITTGAIIHGDTARFLQHNHEHPVAIQLGGSDPQQLAHCAALAADYGYAEVNLNVGCPSDRVQAGRFGACLMKEPQLVADCVAAMKAAVDIPVTVKCRIGVDEQDSYPLLQAFVQGLEQAGVDALIVHARKAWLQGLSPKQNREVPPLQPMTVLQLKRDFSQLSISINGEVANVQQVQHYLSSLDGVMVGRAAYQNPYWLSEVDTAVYGQATLVPTRQQVIRQLLPYIEQQCSAGVPLNAISRHTLGLFQGQPGAKRWRRYLSENAHRAGAGPEVLAQALRRVEDAQCSLKSAGDGG